MNTSFDAGELMPPQWRTDTCNVALRIYNPAVVRFRGRLLMAYRVDSGRGATFQRRIGLCELDEELSIIPGSVQPISDAIHGGDPRCYDPRFLVYDDRLFLHYNNNMLTRPNQIHMVELDADTLEPKSPARPLVLDGPRQEIEKNWMPFEHDGELFAVYRIAPHIILRLDVSGAGPVTCRPFSSHAWDVATYADRFGLPCGGAPPVCQGGVYVSFFHSRIQVSPGQWLRRFWPEHRVRHLPRYLAAGARRIYPLIDQRVYFGGFYTFHAEPPFSPAEIAPRPVLHPTDERPPSSRRRANPTAHAVVYPCGALPWTDGRWLVSYGLHDEYCCLRIVTVPPNLTRGQA